MLKEYLSNLANRFREILGTTEPINAQDFAEKVEDVAVRYNQLGFESGREIGYNQGLEVGYNSAVREGTITITEKTKELKIEGLPKAPKEFILMATTGELPDDDAEYFIRGINYYAELFDFGTLKDRIALLYFGVTQNVSSKGVAIGNTSKSANDKNKIYSFENGTFTLDFSYSGSYSFGGGYAFKWTAIF